MAKYCIYHKAHACAASQAIGRYIYFNPESKKAATRAELAIKPISS